MEWHKTPRDDAWRQAHLAMVERLGKKVWLNCEWCQHSVYADVREFADQHRLDLLTPLLTVSRRLRCTRCGLRSAHAKPEPAR
jgi:hypothetical protein